jgi:GNAT superfamily N-acetyltransferase
MTIRPATLDDTEALVALSERFREQLAELSPVFWRKAPDSFEKQLGWFRILLEQGDTIALLDERDGNVRGFVIGRLQAAPPVYAPGGSVCLVDDFCVADDAEWESLGAQLLAAIEARAKQRGAVIQIVICPNRHPGKRDLLGARGFAVNAEWHVREL